ncbi:exocyst complex component 2-like [Patiria miniata]|uniref:Exocyst complex component 2 n=1 Tax=Patiria miniata TaxID=46514 RepID=A0A914AXD8_PATMI|nr:exocyst complex component 2-like [Patiria miniata]
MNQKKVHEPPKVTGLSPKEGPPGTKVTIRGENLGINAKDLYGLTICGVNCLLLAEWISPSKITCRTTNCKGMGEVIVTTKSAGEGTCTVKFRGVQFLPNALQECSIWMDESSIFERHLTTIHRPSSPLQGGREDPLGLAVESTSVLSDEELTSMFPMGSSNLAHKNFEPVWFLIENHSSTSFDDLKKGLVHVQKQSSSLKTEGPQTFIKSNLGTFMNCQDILAGFANNLSNRERHSRRWKPRSNTEVWINTLQTPDDLSAIHDSLVRHEPLGVPLPDVAEEGEEGEEETPRGYTLEKLEESLIQCNENAQRIFKSVLHRKDRADSTRNALNVLNRFKFLFHLPITIERNIKKGDYEVVINDYERARQLFADTEVTAFKKVYEEVEKRIVDLRVQLKNKLMELPSTLDDQKKLIRYLVELEAPGDPAWECIVNQQHWLLKLLQKCKDDHLQMDQQNNPEPTSVTLRAKVHHSRNRSGSFNQMKFNTADSEGKYSPPQRVLLLEELVDVLQLTLPDFVKLGQSYFSASIVAEAGGKDMNIDRSKEKNFRQMVTEVTVLFANLVRAAFLPDSLIKIRKEERAKYGFWSDTKQDGAAGAWLPPCVRSVRSVLGSMAALDVPSSALDHVHSLVADLRVHCMETLFIEAKEDIRGLHTRETWVLQMDDHGGITSLPMLFESMVVDVVQHLQEVVSIAKAGERDIFSDYDVQRKTVTLTSDILKAFAGCLEQLAFMGETEADTHRLRLSEAQMRIPVSLFQSSEDSLPSMEQCLVIVLSNCNHVSQFVIPNLVEQFKKQGYPCMLEMERNAQEAYIELDEKIFEAYCEQKTDPLVGALEPGMYAGHFDWGDCPKPTGVRPYIKEAVMCSVGIHAEVHAIAPAFMPRVMARVLEAISDEMARLMGCIVEFSQNGALHARLELAAMEEALTAYRNAGTSDSFKEALDSVPVLAREESKRLYNEHLIQFRNEMRFQLSCFTTDSMDSDAYY